MPVRSTSKKTEGTRPPSIAVVLLVYNRPDTTLETIDSLLAQERPLTSVAAVYLADDRSTDHTVAAARARWRSKQPLAVLQPKRHAGTWGSVNHALATLAGRHDWILLLKCDDVVKPGWLGMMCDRIAQCPPSTLTICSSWDSLQPNGMTEPGEDDPVKPNETVPGGASAVRGTLLRSGWWHLSGCAIRTRGFLDVGVFDPTYPQSADQDWLIRGLDRGWDVEYIPRTLLVYRQPRARFASRSLLVHQDLVEQLRLVERFGGVLSRTESIRFHLRLIRLLVRRSARAVIVRRPRILLNAVKLVPRCGTSWVRTLRSSAA